MEWRKNEEEIGMIEIDAGFNPCSNGMKKEPYNPYKVEKLEGF